MNSFEKKEQNLNKLIDKLNSLSLSYSQPNYELEKIRSEKNELSNQKSMFMKTNNQSKVFVKQEQNAFLDEKLPDTFSMCYEIKALSFSRYT